MNDTLVAEIQKFTLASRAFLEREADEQLQGIYGWLPDGSFADASRYPAIQQFDEARETRLQLENYAEDEKTAGFSSSDSRRKIVRETAFTWLNRLVAFRLLEERKLLKQIVAKIDKSNGFIFWLTEGNEEVYKLHQQGDLPLNSMGEGPSNVAYRRFIIWQCGELARDVSVLFDPATLSSRLFPRPPIIKQLVDSMNSEALFEAWRPGNEEVVGWVYQAFNAEELQAAFTAARETKKKFESKDIPAVTQLFTIRWVVRYLVDNTLGRLWMEMHPESRLSKTLTYLVPAQQPQKRELKLARKITFLDPACGSMHFGLIAFDIFAEMYREELENAGKPGWPEKPSVDRVDEIPAAIVTHNIHGIDLDLRAVQLSALTLFLRARTLNKDCTFTDRNLACANVEAITGGQLEAFVSKTTFGHPIYERVLRRLADRLKDSDYLGSLLRLEKDVEALIDAERKKAEFNKQFEIGFAGVSSEQFKTQAGLEEFFDLLTAQLQQYLDHFVRISRQQGNDPNHFADEAGKGLRFLHLIERRYDVVATNPPYLSARKMNKRLSDLMKAHYPIAKQDLYAAFIIRCQELSNTHGLVGMLTMHSFMFIGSYEDLRARLRGRICIETLAHFGGGLFAVGNPGTLQTAAYVLRREPDEEAREEHRGIYFRLVSERDAEAKRQAFESALATHCNRLQHPLAFTYRQADFNIIPEKPWIYWMPEKIQDLFRQGRILAVVAPPKVGLQTGKNARFVRKWWEVGFDHIYQTATSCKDSKVSGGKWFPYMKGGAPLPWYGNQEHVVNWKKDGQEIRIFVDEKGKLLSRPQNTGFYFRRGVTWSDVSPKGFAGRLSPGGFIHDVKGMTCYPSDESIKEVLGIFNSSAAKFILSALNPTISFQVGDIERLPIPNQASKDLNAKVEEAVLLAQHDAADSERTYDFVNPPLSVTEVEERHDRLRQIKEEIDQEVTRLYGLLEADRLALKAELEGMTAVAENVDEEDGETEEEEETTQGAWTDASLARAWVSYAFGMALGKYQIGESEGLGRGNFDAATITAISALIDSDGIMPSDAGHPQDIVSRTLRILVLIRGEESARNLIRAATGGNGIPENSLRGFLDRFTGQPEVSFWRYHFQLYRKRPIYWPLQSPRRKFTVWIFQERFTPNSLFEVRRMVEERMRLLEREIADKRVVAATNRSVARELDKLLDLSDDLRDFSKNLQDIIQAGYTPHIDDGVLLNAAPLHTLLPSWPETKKAWQELAEGKYDWAQQAMDHWPVRVREKCKTNKSFAIAHGLA